VYGIAVTTLVVLHFLDLLVGLLAVMTGEAWLWVPLFGVNQMILILNLSVVSIFWIEQNPYNSPKFIKHAFRGVATFYVSFFVIQIYYIVSHSLSGMSGDQLPPFMGIIGVIYAGVFVGLGVWAMLGIRRILKDSDLNKNDKGAIDFNTRILRFMEVEVAVLMVFIGVSFLTFLRASDNSQTPQSAQQVIQSYMPSIIETVKTIVGLLYVVIELNAWFLFHRGLKERREAIMDIYNEKVLNKKRKNRPKTLTVHDAPGTNTEKHKEDESIVSSSPQKSHGGIRDSNKVVPEA
jgi:hypothetical protein